MVSTGDTEISLPVAWVEGGTVVVKTESGISWPYFNFFGVGQTGVDKTQSPVQISIFEGRGGRV